MASLAIVPDLDEGKQFAARDLATHERTVDQQLLGQGGEETFDHGVVPAITATTHTRREPRLSELLLVCVARVLHATIRRMRPATTVAAHERHAEGNQRQLLIQPRPHGPADD